MEGTILPSEENFCDLVYCKQVNKTSRPTVIKKKQIGKKCCGKNLFLYNKSPRSKEVIENHFLTTIKTLQLRKY